MKETSPYICIAPSSLLAGYVSHYWLGLENVATTHTVLPDGSVDLVIQSDEEVISSRVYGTTTRRTDIHITPDNHYAGIRFKPGKSRHFISLSAQELTDATELTRDILNFSLEEFSEKLPLNGIAKRLDSILENHLIKQQPDETKIDTVIACELVFESDWFVLLQSCETELGFMLPNLEEQAPMFREVTNAKGLWIVIDVEDVDAEYQRLKSLDITIEYEIKDEPWGDRHFVLKDPNGIAVDVVQHL